MSRNSRLILLILFTLSISIVFGKANAQVSSLSITLTVSPLNGQAPFSPSYQSSYRGAVGSVSIIIYWGDGSSNDVTNCGESCPIHTYTVAGTYTITISITDSIGATASDSNTITVYAAIPQLQYSIQVGAMGDDASTGNTGVGVEIQTQTYDVASSDLSNSFWVGDILQNGAFIQFGYELFNPNYYCSYGETIGSSTNCLSSSEAIGYGDARWFWQYWPNSKVVDFYGGIGPANSAGSQGSWHLYQIWPNDDNGWDFVLDGKTVWSFNNYQVSASKDPVFVAAEEVTGSPSASGTLGPVEFRNLEYWAESGWNQATSLTRFSGCGMAANSVSNCEVSIPYGVTMLGTNDLLAGSGSQVTEGGKLTLTLNAPSQVAVLVDEQYQVSGGSEISLTPGTHDLLAPEYVPVSDGIQLRFDHWSDGYTSFGRSIDVTSDTSVEAVYVTQYKLTLSSPLATSGEGWYDQGATASFSSSTAPVFTDTGVMFFDGWLENGALDTWWGSGSLVMDGPHTFTARWFTLNYSIPIVVATIAAIIIMLLRRREGQKGTSEEEFSDSPPFNRSNDRTSAPILEARTHEVASFLDENSVRGSQHITCRYCNAKVPTGRIICPRCGMPAQSL